MRLFLSMYDPDQRRELAQQIAVSADDAQQLPFAIEGLQQVEHGIGHPDVSVAIDGDALGMSEAAGAVAVLAESG